MHGRPKIRIAAIGLGWVSQNRHLPAITRSQDFELVGVVDKDPDTVREVARRYGVRHAVTRTLSDIEWFDKVDAVVVGTPPFAHGEVIERAIGCGRHVLTEKPFVMSVWEGERLSAAAADASRVLAIVHNFQFTRAFARLQRDIAHGRLGALHSMLAIQLSNPRRRLPKWYGDLPGGLFFDESPHLFYLARRLFPGVVLQQARVTGSSSGGSTPSEVYAQLRNPQGQTATLLMKFEEALSEWHVSVSGEHGTADIDMFRDIYVFIPNDGRHEPRDILRNSYRATAGHVWGTVASGLLHVRSKLGYGYDEVLRRFATGIRTGSLQPEYIGTPDALAVLRLQHEILALARTDVVSTPRARAAAATLSQ